jgi:hypothetical protein
MGLVGVEPTRGFPQRILSPRRLPFPPQPHLGYSNRVLTRVKCFSDFLYGFDIVSPQIISKSKSGRVGWMDWSSLDARVSHAHASTSPS